MPTPATAALRTDNRHVTVKASLPAGDEMRVEAVFSTFGVVDSYGDMVDPSAFTDGQEVALTWAHDWTHIVGKGVIRVEDGRAVFVGQFFDTAAGREAYATVKAMGDLQEFSWGFRVLDADFAERDGEYVRVILKAEVYEVSPVLIGANRQTGLLSIKSGGLPLTDHAEAALAAASELGARLRAHAALRTKSGRTLSTANRDRLAVVRDGIQALAADLDDLLAATATDTTDGTKAISPEAVDPAILAFLLAEARRNGVPV